MLRKLHRKIIPLLLVVAIAASFMGAALSAERFTISIRYYDDINITFRLNYPSGGVWSGAQDVPIGGTSISSQIYCVDPFTAFHGQVPNHGGTTGWSHGAVTDTVPGYVSAAPWAMSGAMQRYGDAVRWIIANGYRGVFGHPSSPGLPEDAESRESVARLQSRYASFPWAANIDKEIALMATKVAIWFTVGGRDAVQVVRTSLDGRVHADGTLMSDTFNNLIEALIRDAQIAGAGGTPSQSVPVTTLTAGIDNSHAVFDPINNRYGPLIVTATANGLARATDGIFLTASGEDSLNFYFTDSAFERLPIDISITTDMPVFRAPGTADSGGVFYLVVPEDRGNADNMTISAMVLSANTPVVQGTPVVYAFWDADRQNWDAIQAFAGAAKEGALVDLFAQASINTGIAPRGQIWVSKQVENPGVNDLDLPFSFRLWHTNDITSGGSGQEVDLGNHPVRGADSSFGNIFNLRKGMFAFIDGLPAGPNDWYRIEEINIPAGFNSPASFNIDIGMAAGGAAAGSGNITDWFTLNDEGVGQDALAMVTFTNRRTVDMAQLRVSKTVLAFDEYGNQLMPNISHGSEQRFNFLIQSSTDAVNWTAVPLSNENFLSDGGGLLSTTGAFWLRHRGAAIIELPPSLGSLEYRVIEMPDNQSEFATIYGLYVWREIGGQWAPDPASQVSNFTGSIYNLDMGNTRETASFSLTYDGFYDLIFLNVSLHDMQISKEVSGYGYQNRLFEFQIYYMDDDAPIKLTMDSSATDAIYVEISGNPGGRIGAGGDTLLLRHGETATIANLPTGQYVVRELAPGGGYVTTHIVSIGGVSGDTVTGLSTAPIILSNDVLVAFTNDLTTPQTSEYPNGSHEPHYPNQPFVPIDDDGLSDRESHVEQGELNEHDDTEEHGSIEYHDYGYDEDHDIAHGRIDSGSPRTGDDFPVSSIIILISGLILLTVGIIFQAQEIKTAKYNKVFDSLVERNAGISPKKNKGD